MKKITVIYILLLLILQFPLNLIALPGDAGLSLKERRSLKNDKIITHKMTNADGITGFRTFFYLPVPPDYCWDILRNNKLIEILYNDVDQVIIHNENNFEALIEYNISTVIGRYHYTLIRRFYPKERLITWERQEGDFHYIKGLYRLLPAPEAAGKTLVIYESFVETGINVPGFLANLVAERQSAAVARDIRKYMKNNQ